MTPLLNFLGRTLPVLLLLSVSLPAAATLQTIEQAYELTRDQVRLPEASLGGLTVRLCATCSPVVLRVTGATTWFGAPGEQPPAGQAAVLAAFAAAAGNPRLLVYVYYEPRTLKVKRIVLDTPGEGAQ